MKKNSQKNHHFNIIDFTLIVTIAACLIGIAIRYNLSEVVLHNTGKATITVMVREILTENIDQVQIGDEYYYQRNSKRIGKLTSVEVEPAIIRNIRQDGTIAYTEFSNRSTLTCTVEIEGAATENGFMVGGSEYIGCGSTILVSSPNLKTEWLVVDIEVHD